MQYQCCEEKWIIWGAGKIGKNVCGLLEELGECVECFVDVNEELWGQCYKGTVIKNPELLKADRDHKICVAVMNGVEAIKEKLICEYEYPDSRIFHYFSCITDIAVKNCEILYSEPGAVAGNQAVCILLGCTNGLGLGGIETWNLTFGRMLSERGKNVKYLLRQKDIAENVPKDRQVRVDVDDFNDNWCINQIQAAIKVIEKNLPCVLVTNYANLLIIAAYIVKLMKPGQLKVVSVVHGGGNSLLNRYEALNDCVDVFVGVAKHGICNRLISKGIARKKVKYVVCPVPCPQKLERVFSCEGKAIKIGYAARLRKNDKDKRPEYLLQLIRLLMESGIDFQMEIAGVGDFMQEICDYITEINAEDCVTLCGEIKRDDMISFWKRQDVFVNVSDSEGNSMAMLEAMAQGVVPVLTDVSGVRDSITDGQNGFIVKCGEIEKIKDHIVYLHNHRYLMEAMGMAAYLTIAEKYEASRMLLRFERCIEWNI